MGVCVEGLIRNDFYDMDNIEAVEAELNRVSKLLNDNLQLEGEDVYYPDGMDCGDYQVRSDKHHMSCLYLKKGYWHVGPAYRYQQLFTPPLFVRKGFYDIAKALGKSEIWYCNEFHLWNSGDEEWDYDTQTFEEWLEYITNKYGPIKEYPIDEVMKSDPLKYFPADPVYHDSFMKMDLK